jgi:hypothetical protein
MTVSTYSPPMLATLFSRKKTLAALDSSYYLPILETRPKLSALDGLSPRWSPLWTTLESQEHGAYA